MPYSLLYSFCLFFSYSASFVYCFRKTNISSILPSFSTFIFLQISFSFLLLFPLYISYFLISAFSPFCITILSFFVPSLPPSYPFLHPILPSLHHIMHLHSILSNSLFLSSSSTSVVLYCLFFILFTYLEYLFSATLNIFC